MSSTTLLATDQQRSVLNTLKANQPPQAIAYSPYGHRPAACWLVSMLGLNGELADSVTGHYLLGNGYRAFNPALKRFNSPDSLSPFRKGGLNPYVYCLGDPINRHDPNGHVSFKTIGTTVFNLNRIAKKASLTTKLPPKARIEYLSRSYIEKKNNLRTNIFNKDLLAITSDPKHEVVHPLNLEHISARTVKKHELSLDTTPIRLKKIIDNTPVAKDYKNLFNEIHFWGQPGNPPSNLIYDHFELRDISVSSRVGPGSHQRRVAAQLYLDKITIEPHIRNRLASEIDKLRSMT
ncbi:RHS repeat-associated core domain-containing protein [Pseudomonas sp. G(2018)]|uniref:RHS repeat-associated core domain-containing protein n=1 Tax=Pseudomonas sp. G(2018) TaxID=2502242 RepID=UPI0021141322|nr:RHS repeat-associated core domain-containing protein [Pseudomonas sp. G(2018)]